MTIQGQGRQKDIPEPPGHPCSRPSFPVSSRESRGASGNEARSVPLDKASCCSSPDVRTQSVSGTASPVQPLSHGCRHQICRGRTKFCSILQWEEREGRGGKSSIKLMSGTMRQCNFKVTRVKSPEPPQGRPTMNSFTHARHEADLHLKAPSHVICSCIGEPQKSQVALPACATWSKHQ